MPKRTQTAEILWLHSGLLILFLAVPTVAAMLVEERTFNGINVWIKPLKFQLSTTIHFLTLYFVARLMSESDRRKPVFVTLAWASVIAALFEIALITLRAGQARASHFNYETPLDGILYALMGVGALTMLFPAIYLGIRFWRSGSQFAGGVGLKRGVAVGFIFGSMLTIIFGGYMSQNGAHWTSGEMTDAGGLALVGWSTSGGDLRVAHFFATHLMQILPVIGLLADRLFGSENRATAWPVYLGLIAVGGMSVGTFVQALNGQPFLG